MEAWEKKTCIKFKLRTNERDYVEFIDDGFGKYGLFRSSFSRLQSVFVNITLTGIQAIHAEAVVEN